MEERKRRNEAEKLRLKQEEENEEIRVKRELEELE